MEGAQAEAHGGHVTTGASLMLSFRPIGRKVLVLGTRRLASSRVTSILEADAEPIVVGIDLAEAGQHVGAEMQSHIESGRCTLRAPPRLDSLDRWSAFIDEIDGREKRLFAVCITDTLHAGDDESSVREHERDDQERLSPIARAKLIAEACRSRRIPINVADRPELCDFSFPASHRFSATPLDLADDDDAEMGAGKKTLSALQIAVTTNGKGCRLAGRIRREIVANLPKNVGDAVERVGMMRDMAKRRRPTTKKRIGTLRDPSLRRQAVAGHGAPRADIGGEAADYVIEDVEEEDLTFDNTPINSPVPQLHSPSGQESKHDYINAPAAAAAQLVRREEAMKEERKRRMRWVAQMSEYWPIEYLGSLTQSDMSRALETYKEESREERKGEKEDERRGREKDVRQSTVEQNGETTTKRASSQHSLSLRRPDGQGHIFLVGSGPGHPGLLTAMGHRLLTSSETDVVLSDKLVPASILSLIPKQTPLHIARKFPGNAEGAQSELITLALQAAKEGKRVIRLKQGDPFVYGRGGEEMLAFAKAGIEATLVPGISSALAAPLLLGIPVTQRGAADSMVLCTGVGRGGKSVSLPGYERGRSLVILMGVARLHDVVLTLTHGWQCTLSAGGNEEQVKPAGIRTGAPFPPYTPIAIIERASSTDQRLVASTLDGIEKALELCGEQRPPGMMLIGWAALALHDASNGGNMDVLDDESACAGNTSELERRDRARISRWLGTRGYIMREGLDEAYKRELALLSASTSSTNTTDENIDGSSLPPTTNHGPSGWAPPRYGVHGMPRGGWGAGEEPATLHPVQES